MTGVEELKGKWTEASVENFEKFMEKLEVNVLLRKVGSKTTANEEWIIEGDDITIKITSTFKNKTLKFKLGQEFDEETLDGRKVKVGFDFLQ
ncbi:FABP5 [Bugula neritina]|uniref:FABP5 n=1 Tax=Bugula neritina TaxID=10212 RepID=A0A7J7J2A1_BUGNE|nr:FABP5 [Bugula neritina]